MQKSIPQGFPTLSNSCLNIIYQHQLGIDFTQSVTWLPPGIKTKKKKTTISSPEYNAHHHHHRQQELWGVKVKKKKKTYNREKKTKTQSTKVDLPFIIHRQELQPRHERWGCIGTWIFTPRRIIHDMRQNDGTNYWEKKLINTLLFPWFWDSMRRKNASVGILDRTVGNSGTMMLTKEKTNRIIESRIMMILTINQKKETCSISNQSRLMNWLNINIYIYQPLHYLKEEHDTGSWKENLPFVLDRRRGIFREKNYDWCKGENKTKRGNMISTMSIKEISFLIFH